MADSTPAGGTLTAAYTGTLAFSFTADNGALGTYTESVHYSFTETGTVAKPTSAYPVTTQQLALTGTETATGTGPNYGTAEYNCSATLSAAPVTPGSILFRQLEVSNGAATASPYLPGPSDITAKGAGICAEVPLPDAPPALSPVLNPTLSFPVSKGADTKSFPTVSGPVQAGTASGTISVSGASLTVSVGAATCGVAAPTGATETSFSPTISTPRVGQVAVLANAATAPEAKLAALTRTGSANSPTYYQTIYQGDYSYSSRICTDAGVKKTVDTTYKFVIDVVDSYTDNGSQADGLGKYTEKVEIAASASGGSSESTYNDNELTDMTTCTVVSDPTRIFTATRKGTYIESEVKGLSDAARNYEVYWSVPWRTDTHGVYILDHVPDSAPGVGENCTETTGDGTSRNYTAQDGTSLVTYYDKTTALQWQDHALPSCGGDYLTPDDQFFKLWNSSTSTTLPLVHNGYRDSFSFAKSISGDLGGKEGPGSCAYKVNYATQVFFSPWTIRTTPTAKGIPPVPSDNNKLGALFLEDAIRILSGSTYGGESATVLFPGMTEGGQLSVQGQVVSGAHGASTDAYVIGASSTGPVVYQGTADLQAAIPTQITLHETAAGAQFFADHAGGPVTMRFTATFTPTGHGKPLTASGTSSVSTS